MALLCQFRTWHIDAAIGPSSGLLLSNKTPTEREMVLDYMCLCVYSIMWREVDTIEMADVVFHVRKKEYSFLLVVNRSDPTIYRHMVNPLVCSLHEYFDNIIFIHLSRIGTFIYCCFVIFIYSNHHVVACFYFVITIRTTIVLYIVYVLETLLQNTENSSSNPKELKMRSNSF